MTKNIKKYQKKYQNVKEDASLYATRYLFFSSPQRQTDRIYLPESQSFLALKRKAVKREKSLTLV